jgi:hypothetical protein
MFSSGVPVSLRKKRRLSLFCFFWKAMGMQVSLKKVSFAYSENAKANLIASYMRSYS